MTAETTTPTRGNPLVRMLTKIGLSLLLGVLAFVLSQALNAPKAELVVGVGVSVFVSGIAVVVQFLIEVERRLDDLAESQRAARDSFQRHSTEQQRELTAQIAKINSSTQLFSELEEAGLQPRVLAQLARNAVEMHAGESVVTRFAQHEIDRLDRLLKCLADEADAVYDGEDRDWLLGLPRAARRRLDAISLTTVDGGKGFVDGGLWDSELGERYLQAQHEAIRQGNLTIRRLFVIDRPDAMNDEDDLRSVVARHAAIGVDVRVLRPSARRSANRLEYFTDFIVVDDELCYQAIPSSPWPDGTHQPVIVSTTLVTEPSRVRRQAARFAALWEEAGTPGDPRDPGQRSQTVRA